MAYLSMSEYNYIVLNKCNISQSKENKLIISFAKDMKKWLKHIHN